MFSKCIASLALFKFGKIKMIKKTVSGIALMKVKTPIE